MRTLFFVVASLGLLIALFWCVLYKIRYGLNTTKKKCFRVSLIDLINKSEAIDTFELYEYSFEKAKKTAYTCIQTRLFFYGDSNYSDEIREVIRINEAGADFIAGHEFDVLPEALRKFAINISIVSK